MGRAQCEKRKHRKQNYRTEWERDPLCSPWLGPDPRNPTKAICKWCNSSLVADITLIKKHKDTNKYIKELEACKTTSSNALQQYVKPQNTSISLNENVKNAEIRICGFITAHNIPFAVVDDMIPCLKSALSDSKILDGVCMKRMKATKIVTNVIGASHKDDIPSQLRNT